MSYDRIYASWFNSDLEDWIGTTVRTYSKSNKIWDATVNLTSVNITRPGSYNWTFFNVTINNTANATFSILDGATGEVLLSGLTSTSNSLLTVTANPIKIWGQFNDSVFMSDWNVSWSLTPNYDPINSNPTPANASTGLSFNPRLGIYVQDDNGHSMNVTFRTNASGSWANIGTNSSVSDGWYNQTTSNMNTAGTTYYWSVNTSDGHGGWDNDTYHFTATQDPVNSNPWPGDTSTGVELNPRVTIRVVDSDGHDMNVTFRSNASGSWANIGTNSSVSDGWYNQTTSNMNTVNTEYFWSVNTSDGHGGWDNDTYSFTTTFAPVNSNPLPVDTSTGIGLNPTLVIYVSDGDSHLMNVTFRTNASGSWATINTNSSVSDGWYNQTTSNMNVAGETYYWSVNTSDGWGGWDNDTYSFTSTASPVNSNPTPADTATGVSLDPTLVIKVTDADGHLMNVTFRTNASGSWATLDTNSSVSDGWYNQSSSDMDSYSTTYYWSVNTSDGWGGWDNDTYYFTTEAAPNNPPTVDFKTPVNESTGVNCCPAVTCEAYVNDTDGDTLHVTWATNASGSWVAKHTNTSVSANSTVSYQFSVFSNYSVTYYWKVFVNDTVDNVSEIYHFTAEGIATSVDAISPYSQISSPLTIDATGDTCLDNVTLNYRWSTDNSTWTDNWWNTSLSNRKPIALNVSTGDTPENYTVSFNITYDSDMQTDFDDLRFIKFSDNSTELDYWIENKSDSSWATVWLELRDNITTTNQTLAWMYYGNATATSNSNGTNTFDFFDGFDTFSGWTGDTGDYAAATDGTRTVLKVTGSGAPGEIFNDVSTTTNYTVEIDIRDTDDSANNPHPGFMFAGTGAADYEGMYYRASSNSIVGCDDAGFGSPLSSQNIDTAWHTLQAVVLEGLLDGLYFDNIRQTAFDDWDVANSFTKVGIWHHGSQTDGYYDSLRVRKYVSPEPTSYVGSEKKNGWQIWEDGTNPDTSSPWSWSFDFPNDTGYYEFYSVGKKAGSTDESAPGSADSLCHYFGNTAPVNSNPWPDDTSTGVEVNPRVTIYVSDGDGHDMNVTFRTNASGSWATISTNSSVSDGWYNQTTSTLNSENTTYWWSVNTSDGHGGWDNDTYSFTTLSEKPVIVWENPTPPDDDTIAVDWVHLNTTITDDSNTSAFFDWNRSLLGYWSFDFYNSTHVYDNSTYLNNGSFQGADFGSDNLTSGKYGNSLQFDGDDDYIKVDDSGNFPIGLMATGQESTVSLWININTLSHGTNVVPFEQSVDTNNRYIIWFQDSDNTLRFWPDGNNHATVISAGQWYHVVTTVDGSNSRMFVNTAEVGSATAYTPTDTNNDLWIGSGPRYPANDPFPGLIDEVCIWNRVLSWEEINASYNNTVNRLTHNFTGLADGIHNYTAYAIDAAGNLNITSQRQVTIDTIAAPTVTTNATTGVEETNATLWGYLVEDGGEACTVRFEYNTSTDYGINTTNQSLSEGNAFSAAISGLTSGDLYHFRAFANNTVYDDTGGDLKFFTKPPAVTNLTETASTSTSLTYEWNESTVNITATAYTRIQYQTGSNPTSITDGSNTYNNTDETDDTTGLTPGTRYYFSAFAWGIEDSVGNWNDTYDTMDAWTNPGDPTGVGTVNGTSWVNISFTHGTNGEYTMVRRNATGSADYPADRASGVEVANTTNTWANDTGLKSGETYYYSLWTFDSDGNKWCVNKVTVLSVSAAFKIIMSQSRDTYSLEIDNNGDTLYGIVNQTNLTYPIDTDWHYLALTYDGSNMRLYMDGAQVNSTSLSTSLPAVDDNLTAGFYLTGYMDELRISSTARSAAWINTSFQNLDSPTTFARFESPKGVLSTWQHRKKITINSSLVENTLSEFPFLVFNSSDSNLSTNALASGNDIIFLNTSIDWTTGTWRNKIDHEIEMFNSTSGELAAWVRISTLSSSTDTEFYIYYGNTLCNTNRQNSEGVWSSTYKMVHHMEESSGDLIDSTSNNNNGTNNGPATLNTSGMIDGAYDFDNSGDFITIGSSPNFGAGPFTITLWAKAFSFAAGSNPDWADCLVGRGLTGLNNPGDFCIYIDGAGIGSDFEIDLVNATGVRTNNIDTDEAITLNNWYYVSAVYDGSEIRLYVNGTFKVSAVVGPIGTSDSDLLLGRTIDNPSHSSYYYDLHGGLDEVRIEYIQRNNSWLNASFDNMNNKSTNSFLLYGAQETKPVAPSLSSPVPSDGATGQSLNPRLSIIVNDTNTDAMDITFRTNATGSWGDIGSNNSVYNGTYAQTNSSMDGSNTKYWWSVNVTDGSFWTNQTYSFTTAAVLSFGSATMFNDTVMVTDASTDVLNATHFVIAWLEYNSFGMGPAHAIIGSVSDGDTVTFGTEVQYESNDSWYNVVTALDNTHFVAAYEDGGDSLYGKAIVGTVSGGDSISYGNKVVFEAASTAWIEIAALNSTHCVIAYMDNGDSGKGTAIVGTISGDSISFGTPVVFEDGTTRDIDIDSLDNTHVVVAYGDDDNSGYGTAVVGTISDGDVLSFGTPVVYESAGIEYTSVSSLNSTHCVIAYQDEGNSDYGTAVVGTISGDSISFGTPQVFESATTNEISTCSLDNTHSVIAYQDGGDSNYGKGIIASISDTSISFNDPVQFEASESDFNSAASFNSTHFVVGFWAWGSEEGRGIIGIYQ